MFRSNPHPNRIKFYLAPSELTGKIFFLKTKKKIIKKHFNKKIESKTTLLSANSF